jgi:hypothetical protein
VFCCWLRPQYFVLVAVLWILWITTGTESGRQSREELQVIDGDGSVMLIWALLVETGPLFCVAAS